MTACFHGVPIVATFNVITKCLWQVRSQLNICATDVEATLSDAIPLIPPNAAIAWATKDNLFVQMATPNGPPVIVRFKKTIDGLAAGLGILIEDSAPAPRRLANASQISADHPIIKRPKPKYSETEREAAREALKKAGIL